MIGCGVVSDEVWDASEPFPKETQRCDDVNGLERGSLADLRPRSCPADVDGVEPRKLDGAHFDPSGSVWLARWMLPEILRGGGPRLRCAGDAHRRLVARARVATRTTRALLGLMLLAFGLRVGVGCVRRGCNRGSPATPGRTCCRAKRWPGARGT